MPNGDHVILLFGSSFNPPHLGHLHLLRAAVDFCKPDLVLLVPTGKPPHKKAVYCPTKIRMMMTACIASELSGKDCRAAVLDYEVAKKSKSYTIDTVKHVKKLYPDCEVKLLVGSDMLTYFPNWHKYEELLSLCGLVAALRDNIDKVEVETVAKKLKSVGGKVEIMEFSPLVMSSTQIRKTVQTGGDIEAFVPKCVAQKIKENSLYEIPSHESIQKTAKITLGASRYAHTLAVKKLAVKLAKHYGANVDKVITAALLHDIAKEMPKENMLQYGTRYDIISKWTKKPESIWHAHAGAEYAKETLGILDDEILDAIRYHTSARAAMTLLDTVIYVADMLSEDRVFPEADGLRALAFVDLNKCLLESLKLNVSWMKKDGKPIDEGSFEAIEFLERTL